MFEKLTITSFQDRVNPHQGGYIFFKHLVQDKKKEEIQSLLNQFPKNLFLAVDFECHLVNRLSHLYSLKTPSEILTLSKKERRSYFEDQAIFLKKLGFNLNFSPLVDLKYEDSFMNERSYSSDPIEVIKIAQEFTEAYEKVGIFSCLKHFPGHGSSRSKEDSHKGLFFLERYHLKQEIRPFQEVKSPFIMSAHVLLQKKDPPITFHPTFIKTHLKNFQGLLITDDLHMGALINYSLKERVILSLQAGHDLLLFSQNDLASQGRFRKRCPEEFTDQLPSLVSTIILQALKNGTLNKEELLQKKKKVEIILNQK